MRGVNIGTEAENRKLKEEEVKQQSERRSSLTFFPPLYLLSFRLLLFSLTLAFQFGGRRLVLKRPTLVRLYGRRRDGISGTS